MTELGAENLLGRVLDDLKEPNCRICLVDVDMAFGTYEFDPKYLASDCVSLNAERVLHDVDPLLDALTAARDAGNTRAGPQGGIRLLTLCRAMRAHLRHLTTLMLCWAQVTARECALVAAALRGDALQLVELDVSHNGLTRAAAYALTPVICHPSLRVLCIESNALDAHAVSHVLTALQARHPHPPLERVDLSDNDVWGALRELPFNPAPCAEFEPTEVGGGGAGMRHRNRLVRVRSTGVDRKQSLSATDDGAGAGAADSRDAPKVLTLEAFLRAQQSVRVRELVLGSARVQSASDLQLSAVFQALADRAQAPTPAPPTVGSTATATGGSAAADADSSAFRSIGVPYNRRFHIRSAVQLSRLLRASHCTLQHIDLSGMLGPDTWQRLNPGTGGGRDGPDSDDERAMEFGSSEANAPVIADALALSAQRLGSASPLRGLWQHIASRGLALNATLTSIDLSNTHLLAGEWISLCHAVARHPALLRLDANACFDWASVEHRRDRYDVGDRTGSQRHAILNARRDARIVPLVHEWQHVFGPRWYGDTALALFPEHAYDHSALYPGSRLFAAAELLACNATLEGLELHHNEWVLPGMLIGLAQRLFARGEAVDVSDALRHYPPSAHAAVRGTPFVEMLTAMPAPPAVAQFGAAVPNANTTLLHQHKTLLAPSYSALTRLTLTADVAAINGLRVALAPPHGFLSQSLQTLWLYAPSGRVGEVYSPSNPVMGGDRATAYWHDQPWRLRGVDDLELTANAGHTDADAEPDIDDVVAADRKEHSTAGTATAAASSTPSPAAAVAAPITAATAAGRRRPYDPERPTLSMALAALLRDALPHNTALRALRLKDLAITDAVVLDGLLPLLTGAAPVTPPATLYPPANVTTATAASTAMVSDGKRAAAADAAAPATAVPRNRALYCVELGGSRLRAASMRALARVVTASTGHGLRLIKLGVLKETPGLSDAVAAGLLPALQQATHSVRIAIGKAACLTAVYPALSAAYVAADRRAAVAVASWARLSVLIASYRANRSHNALSNSVQPLLRTILALADVDATFDAAASGRAFEVGW